MCPFKVKGSLSRCLTSSRYLLFSPLARLAVNQVNCWNTEKKKKKTLTDVLGLWTSELLLFASSLCMNITRRKIPPRMKEWRSSPVYYVS